MPSNTKSTLVPSELKVVELRKELSDRNLSTKGKKKELVERLEDALNNEGTEPEVPEPAEEQKEVPKKDLPVTVETIDDNSEESSKPPIIPKSQTEELKEDPKEYLPVTVEIIEEEIEGLPNPDVFPEESKESLPEVTVESPEDEEPVSIKPVDEKPEEPSSTFISTGSEPAKGMYIANKPTMDFKFTTRTMNI